jgi:hypothetical protein
LFWIGLAIFWAKGSDMTTCGYRFEKNSRKLVCLLAVGAAAVAISAAITPLSAEPGGLDGNWSGGGSLTYPSGAKESARCRASYKKKSGTSYAVSARCASASGKVEQSAVLTETGSNQYSGSFFNTEYKVDGTITVTVKGNTQNVSIVSPAGSSAHFRLTK